MLKYRLTPLLFTIIFFIILTFLGFWQLSRFNEKRQFTDTVRHNIENPAKEISDLQQVSAFTKLQLRGQFLSDKDFYLYGRRSGAKEKDGYYLLTPFKSFDNQFVLVARGWFPRSIKDSLQNIINSQDESIVAISLPSEKKQFFVPDNDLKNSVLFTLNVEQIAKYLNLPLPNYYLFQVESTNPVKLLKPLSTSGLVNIRNDHLEYALTWFSLAGCLIIIYIIYLKKQNPLTNN